MRRTGRLGFGYGNWIFLAAAFNLFTCAQGEPGAQYVRFTSEPSDLVVAPGAAAALPCGAGVGGAGGAGAGVRLRWQFQSDDLLSAGDADRQQLINGTLTILRMSARTAGRYQCVASADGVGTIVSREALVMLAEPPEFEPATRTVLGSAGSPALLACALRAPARAQVRVLSAPPPPVRARPSGPEPPVLKLNVTWLRNGAPLALDARTQLTPSGALELDPAHAHDAGAYTCRVAVPAGEHRDGPPVELRVAADSGAEEAPRFVAAPADTTAMEGATVTLDCAAAGRPRPEITWLHNGAPIDLSSLDARARRAGSGSLQLTRLRAADAGLYTCRATALLLSDASCELRVLTVPRVSAPDAPVLAAAVAGEARLRCSARGRPPPNVRWLKDGEPLSLNHRDVDLPDGSSLRIAGVLPVDSGMFQCVGSSVAGTSAAAIRLVPLPPEHDIPATYNPKSVLDSLRAKNSLLSPESEGPDSLAEYSDVNSPPLPEAERPDPLADYSDANSPQSPEPEGRDSFAEYPDDVAFAYTPAPEVVQGNYLEDVSINGTSPLLTGPRELRALLVKPRFVTLGWLPGQRHDNVTSYLLSYRVKGSLRERVALGGLRHELNVGALTPDTDYTFAVRASSPAGLSPPSETLEVRTPSEESAHLAPSGLQATAQGAHALRVTWLAPPSRPDTYTLHYTEEDTGRSQQLWVREGATTATLSGLRAGALYRVRVAAAGGASSPELRARTAPAPPPAPPSRVTIEPAGLNGLLVRWAAPTAPAAPPGYRVRYRPAGTGGGGGQAATAPPDARQIELKGLEPDTIYQVRVCASPAGGAGAGGAGGQPGACSAWQSARTAPRAADRAVPPPPPPLNARAGAGWVAVRWGGGGAGGAAGASAARGWALGWGLGVPDETARDLPPTARSYVIRDLQPNSEYVISLRASNSLGLGPPVYATVRTLPPGALGGDEPDEEEEEGDEGDEEEGEEEEPLLPPLGLKVIMLSGTTAVVYWTDPTLPKGQTATDGRRYVVRYGPTGAGTGAGTGTGARPRLYNASDLNCMLDDLRPFTKYDFAVKLIKGDRESPWSMLVSNTSLAAPPSAPRDLRAAPAPSGRAVDLLWEKPARPNGLITGYVVTYAVVGASEWSALSLGGERTRARVERLRARTHYQFRVQARTAAGLGPPCAPAAASTTEELGGQGATLAGATSAWLWASAGGACAVLALAAALALSLCCRARPAPEPLSTYQKASASTGIKPPDLWIHHDQMELKQLDKSLHSSNMSGGSAEGLMGGASSLTLARPEYEPARAQPASLDRRHYVPTYVAPRYSPSCSGSEGAHSEASCRARLTPMSGVGGMGSLSAGGGMGGTLSSMGGGGGTLGGMGGTLSSMGVGGGTLGCGACGGVCERRHGRAPPMQLPDPGPLASPQSSLASVAPLQSAACGDVYAAAAAARERGHYVAYEPLGHYTHRDSLSSEGERVAGAGVGAAAGAAASRAGSLRRPPAAPLHSFTPPADGTGRETSPYKSAGSSPGHANRLQMGPVPASAAELEPLTPSRSTERLQREMQNLEGLMKDLSAITQQQFHC